MTYSTRVRFVLAAVMLCAAILANQARPTKFLATIAQRQPLATEIPKVFKHWSKLPTDIVTVLDPTKQAVLDYLYSETLSANYVNANNQLLMLSVAYGKDQSEKHELHKPDLCYPAQGFTILEERDFPLKLDAHRSIFVRYLKAQKGQRIEPLIYWTTAGNYVYHNSLQQRIIKFKYGRDNIIPDGMIVRVSILTNDSAVALAAMTDFVEDWYATIPEIQRSRYFGNESL